MGEPRSQNSIDHNNNNEDLMEQLQALGLPENLSEDTLEKIKGLLEKSKQYEQIKELVAEAISEKDNIIAERDTTINQQLHQILELEAKVMKLENVRGRGRASSTEFLRGLEGVKDLQLKYQAVLEEMMKSQEEKAALDSQLSSIQEQLESKTQYYEDKIDALHKEVEQIMIEKNKMRDEFLQGSENNVQLAYLENMVARLQKDYNELDDKFKKREKEHKEKVESLQLIVTQYEARVVAEQEAEKVKLGYEKKLTEMQRKYLDQIKILEAKLKKKSDESSNAEELETQKKRLQEENEALLNLLREKEEKIAEDKVKMEAMIKENEEKIDYLEKRLIAAKKESVREVETLNSEKEEKESRENELKLKIEELNKNHQKAIKDITERFEKKIHELSEANEKEISHLKSENEKKIQNIREDLEGQIKILEEENEAKIAEIREQTQLEVEKAHEESKKKIKDMEKEFNKKMEMLEEDLLFAQRAAVEAKIGYATVATDKERYLFQIKKMKNALNQLPEEMKTMVEKAAA